jgi:hypothetical protein
MINKLFRSWKCTVDKVCIVFTSLNDAAAAAAAAAALQVSPTNLATIIKKKKLGYIKFKYVPEDET